MSIKIQVQMTVKMMYQFLLHHNYTSFSGIFSVVLGVIFAYVGVISMGDTEVMLVVLYFVFAFLYIFSTPVFIYQRAKTKVKKTKAFEYPTVYELTESGILIGQADGTGESMMDMEEIPWGKVLKVTTTTGLVLVYISKLQALIMPKAAFGENYTTAVKMISTHVSPDKVKFRTMA